MNHREYIVPIGDEAENYDEIFIGVLRKHKELIRCKDCRKNRAKNWVDCDIAGMYGRTADNFCSLAEKREEMRKDVE